MFPFLAFIANGDLYPLRNIPRNKIFLEYNREVLPKKKGKKKKPKPKPNDIKGIYKQNNPYKINKNYKAFFK